MVGRVQIAKPQVSCCSSSVALLDLRFISCNVFFLLSERRCGVLSGTNSGIGINCTNHGHCYDGVCICMDGWEGVLCERRSCPLDCSGHGACDDSGICHCDIPFFGKTCSLSGSHF
jgi:hypothetical protein